MVEGRTLDISLATMGPLVLGGALIGLALAALRLLTGRVMSASGMVGSLLGGHEGPAAASIAFIAGLLAAPSLLALLGEPAAKPAEAGWPLLVAGGLLVGFGARLGEAGLVSTIWGAVRRSGWAAAALCAMAAGAALSLMLLGRLAEVGAA